MIENKKEYTFFSKAVIVGVVLTTILMSVINGTISNPVRVFGAFLPLFAVSSLIGIVPYLIFRNKIKNPKIVISGMVYILLELLLIVATIKVAPSDINEFKSTWINNCVKNIKSGNNEEEKLRYCECVLNGLVEKYTWEKFSVMKSSPELSQITKDLGHKCMEKEGYLFGDNLKETYKSSYIESCVQTGASETTCSCYADFLIEKLGVDGFGEMGKVLDEKPINSPEVKKYLDIVTEQKNKCGSLE